MVCTFKNVDSVPEHIFKRNGDVIYVILPVLVPL